MRAVGEKVMNSLDNQLANKEQNASTIKKFVFETDFTEALHEESVQSESVLEEPVPDDSSHVLEETFEEGYQKGLKEGVETSKSMAEQRCIDLLQSLQEQLKQLSSEHLRMQQSYEEMMMRILDQIVSKVFPELIKSKGLDEVFGFIRSIMSKEPPITHFLLYVPTNEKGMLEQEIKKIQGSKNITVIEDESLCVGDCRLSFDETTIERSTQRIMTDILKAMSRFKNTEELLEPQQNQEKQGDSVRGSDLTHRTVTE